jgi:predicted Zn finger-like uncharacterized protein
MRAITHCPVCQTQFFVSEQQLDQHNGQVRCGHCLHVFDAKAHSVTPVDAAASDTPDLTESTAVAIAVETEHITTSIQESTLAEPEVSTYIDAVADATPIPDIIPADATDAATATDVSEVASGALTSIDQSVSTSAAIVAVPTLEHELAVEAATASIAANTNEVDTNAVTAAEMLSVDTALKADTTEYFDYLTEPPAAIPRKQSRLWLVLVLILLLLAIMQSLYFLRNPIAIYYPNLKPYLQQACHTIGCSIDLPKKIELIIIDDSDMQEDADHVGLIHFTSTLINQASFHQAYPNVELTLTDLDDKPTLRRLFKPREYLPAHTRIAAGIAPAEEVRVKLAITVSAVPVAGYRVFVTY